jgi:DnaJ-class molecular chaperone
MARNTQDCPECHGTGEVMVHALWERHYDRKLIETCPTCGGSGRAQTTKA